MTARLINKLYIEINDPVVKKEVSLARTKKLVYFEHP
jgi:hypothetical protein